MITTRNKAIIKLHNLEEDLFSLVKPKIDLIREVGQIYFKKISEIRRNISYVGEIAYIHPVHDSVLGDINLKRITKFVEENRRSY